MTVDEAIDKLSEQRCPVDDMQTMVEVEYDDEGRQYAFERCTASEHHMWPYERFTIEYDTNWAGGDFDPATVAECFDEYGLA